MRVPRFVLGALSVFALIGVAFGPSAHAQTKPSEAEAPSCLDQSITDELGQSLRPRGVQKRDFLKDGRVQIVARGGVFAADLFSTSYMYGGAVAYFLTEDFGVELGFDVTPIRLDLDAPLAKFFEDDRFEDPGNGYLAMANLLWSPVHVKMKIGDSIVHSDFMFALGGGRLLHDTVQGITFDAGGVLELYTTRYVTLRFDVRDVVAVQEAVTETRLTNNITATMGLALWLP